MHPATCGIRAGCAHIGALTLAFQPPPSRTAAGLQVSKCCTLIPGIGLKQSGPAATNHLETMANGALLSPGRAGVKRQYNTHPVRRGRSVEFPPHQVGQTEALSGLTNFGGPQFDRFGASAGVENRRISLPLAQYGQLSGFTEANEILSTSALTLGERALLSALDSAEVRPADVDIVFSTTVTGLAVPTLEARLAHRVGLRADVKRVPLFGLGCVAGAAGVARMHDYLLGVSRSRRGTARRRTVFADAATRRLLGRQPCGHQPVWRRRSCRRREGDQHWSRLGPGCWPRAAGSTPTPKT